MSNKKKNNYRNCLAEMYQITDAVHVEVTSRLFYIWNGFEENPHGMQMLSKKESTIKLLQLAGNEAKGATITDINHKSTSQHENIQVYYPGSKPINVFEKSGISHELWLNFVLEHGAINISRNNKSNGGITSRIDFGYTQKQKITLKKMKCYKGIYMPFPSFPNFNGKSSNKKNIYLIY